MNNYKYYSSNEIDRLKETGKLHSKLQKILYDKIQVGCTGKELDDISKDFFRKEKSKSAFKNFQGYPSYICVSINDQLIHGIPNTSHKFFHGDIISIDIGIKFNDYIVDGAFTVIVSEKGKENSLKNSSKHKLVLKTRSALKNSLKPNIKRIGDFCKAFDEEIREENYFLTEDYCGHGVGRHIHEEPSIPNSPKVKFFYNWKLLNGMVLAIEPMVFDKPCKTKIADDKWTVVSNNGALSAHFEETIAIIEGKIVSLNPFNELDENNLIKS